VAYGLIFRIPRRQTKMTFFCPVFCDMLKIVLAYKKQKKKSMKKHIFLEKNLLEKNYGSQSLKSL
jgi:hypothetical protein